MALSSDDDDDLPGDLLDADLLYKQVMDTLVRCAFTEVDALVEMEQLMAEAAERALPLPVALNTYHPTTGSPLRFVAGADPKQLPEKYRLITVLIPMARPAQDWHVHWWRQLSGEMLMPWNCL